MKILIFLVVLIPSLIAVFLFVNAALWFGAPQLLTGDINSVIAVCSVVFGIILLIPLLLAAVYGIINLISKVKNGNKKQKQG